MVTSIILSGQCANILDVYLIVRLLCASGAQLLYVLLCRRQVCRQIPDLDGAVLTAGHHERRFHPSHRDKDGGSLLSSSFTKTCLPANSLSVVIHVISKNV